MLHRSAPTRREWHETARRVEGLGYDTLLLSEHFGAHFTMGSGLVSAAEATSGLRVGTMVCNTDFRHPAVLAKEAASIDVLTEGRFELGLGAGWMLSDYRTTGIPFDPPAVRFERFRESLYIRTSRLSHCGRRRNCPLFFLALGDHLPPAAGDLVDDRGIG